MRQQNIFWVIILELKAPLLVTSLKVQQKALCFYLFWIKKLFFILFKRTSKDVQKLLKILTSTLFETIKKFHLCICDYEQKKNFILHVFKEQKNLIFYLSFIKFSSHVWNFSYQTFMKNKNIYVILFYLTLNQNIHLF